MQSDRVPDTRPRAPAPVSMSVVMFVTVIVLLLVVMLVFVPVVVVVVVAGLLHLPRMTRKTPCSTSTPAIRALLQKPRRPKPLQRVR
jgi:hypothetical protein